MKPNPTFLRVAPLVVLFACSSGEVKLDSGEAASPGGEWEELDDGGSGADGDDKGDADGSDADDGKDEEYQDCSDEVREGAACAGSWEETLCLDADGVMWWCEDGVWTADKD